MSYRSSDSRRWARVCVLAAWVAALASFTRGQELSAVGGEEPPSAASGQQPDNEGGGPVVQHVEVGLGGFYKVGHWTPVRVTLKAGARPLAGRLEWITADSDGTPVVYGSEQTLSLAAGAEQQWTGYVKFGSPEPNLTVQVRDGEQLRCRAEIAVAGGATSVSSTAEWIVTIGPDVGVASAVRKQLRADGEGSIGSRVEDTRVLPDHWSGYEGVDMLVLSINPELLTGISDPQAAALEHAVRMGSRVLVCAGSGAVRLSSSPRFQWLVPGSVSRSLPLRDFAGLESFASATDRIVSQEPISVAQLEQPEGMVELEESLPGAARVPLVVRTSRGFGYLVFCGMDLTDDPFPQWDSRPRLVAQLLQTLANDLRQTVREGQRQTLAHIGYRDLSGQLRGSLDQFSGVTLVAFSWVAVLVAAYILLIGPGDYFLLRLGGRMHWSWLTFPIVVLLFCTLAWYGASSFKTAKVSYNQVDVVDVDTIGGLVRGTTWTHVYSPQADRFDLSFSPIWNTELVSSGQASGEESLVWQGLPGNGLGGLQRGGTQGLGGAGEGGAYRVETPGGDKAGRIRQMPITVAGTKSLITRWSQPLPMTYESSLYVEYASGRLRGECMSPAPAPLSDAMILFGDFAFLLDRKILPGDVIRMDDYLRPRQLEWRLKRTKVVEQEAISTTWDERQLNDVPRLMEIMMFHKAAGGRVYTQLSHRFQAYLDLSDHLALDRAILVGRCNERASQLLRDGQSQDDAYQGHWTFYRAVLPVQRATPASASTR